MSVVFIITMHVITPDLLHVCSHRITDNWLLYIVITMHVVTPNLLQLSWL